MDSKSRDFLTEQLHINSRILRIRQIFYIEICKVIHKMLKYKETIAHTHNTRFKENNQLAFL